jgi:hypothetical protein
MPDITCNIDFLQTGLKPRPRVESSLGTFPTTTGSVALTGAHATRSYRCCTSGSNIEQLVDELNFAGDLGLAEEAMERIIRMTSNSLMVADAVLIV